jgi:hypothetical protein
MNEQNCDTKNDNTTHSKESPGQAEVCADQMRQILELMNRGEEADRVRELLTAIEAEPLRQLNEGLAMEAQQKMEQAIDLQLMAEGALRSFLAAVTRTDLTIPESLFLWRLITKEFDRMFELQLAAKQRIEAKLKPQKTRNLHLK